MARNVLLRGTEGAKFHESSFCFIFLSGTKEASTLILLKTSITISIKMGKLQKFISKHSYAKGLYRICTCFFKAHHPY